MELILVRHGQAEEGGNRLNDAQRELTKEGKRSARQSAKALERYLPPKARLSLWSSPLIRARQTAQIIAKILDHDDITELECIGSGDLAGLTRELIGLAKDDTCVIVVGHEPHLSTWSQQICGLSLPFGKGSAAGITLFDTERPSGKLLWFFRAEAIDREKKSRA